MAGSWVFGFFRDADQQDPVILGSIPGVESLNGTSIPADASSSSVGAAYSSATNTSQYTEGSPSAGAANTSALDGDDIAAQQNNTSTSTSAFINNLVRIAVGENGTSNSAGRSKYGVNDAWCAAFLTWCIKQTGAIPTSDLPANPNAVAEWLKWPNGKGGKYVIKIANPKVLYAGDILIRDAAQDHIGLVSKGGSITGGYTSVEGNTGKNRSVMVRDKKGGFNYVLRWKGAFGGTDVPITTTQNSDGITSVQGIPVLGMFNPTLKSALGGDGIEKFATLKYASGNAYVAGRVSVFGGSNDKVVTVSETGAISGENLRQINSNAYYIAGRWDYSKTPKSSLRSKTMTVYNPINGKSVSGVRIVDWGPNTSTRRVWDVSNGVANTIGVSTDQEVYVAFE
jgi:hypothetical protein